MLSLINDARLNAGLKSLGYINTKLYSLMADPASTVNALRTLASRSLAMSGTARHTQAVTVVTMVVAAAPVLSQLKGGTRRLDSVSPTLLVG